MQALLCPIHPRQRSVNGSKRQEKRGVVIAIASNLGQLLNHGI
jgi:hypothetical protein